MENIVKSFLIIFIALTIAVVFYIFKQDKAYVGKYTVLYYKNQCENFTPEIFPQDLQALMGLPCVIRITWQEEITTNLFQEYCYLPGRGIEKGSLYQKK